MTGPETSSSEARRCASCGARNRGDGDWCALCGAVSGPPDPEPEPTEPGPDRELTDEMVDELVQRLGAQESGVALPGRMAVLGGLLQPGAARGMALGVGLIAMLGVAVAVVAVFAVVGLAL